MKLDSLDHLVLTVTDIDATCAFYEKALGMAVIRFGAGRMALTFGQQKINLHQAGKEFEPKADIPTPGALDLCFIADRSHEKVIEKLTNECWPIIEGPVVRTGAIQKINSVYVRDPDQNLIEISELI